MFRLIRKSEAEKNDEILRLQSENEKLHADLEYVAMMTDVDIDEKGEEYAQ